MAKFETWLDMNLKLVDGSTVVDKVILEGPDGTIWGTWPRNFPNLTESIIGMMAALREELPKGKHGAKLLALSEDGTQMSCYPLTVVGSSEAATESAQNNLISQRGNALFLSNVEKGMAGLMAMVQHTNEIAVQIADANRNLLADAERARTERDDAHIRVMREQGKQNRMDELAKQIAPLLPLGLALLTDFAEDWMAKRKKARESGQVGATATGELNPPTTPPESVQSEHAETGEQGVGDAASEQPASDDHHVGDSQPADAETDGEERHRGDGERPTGRSCGTSQKPPRGREYIRKERSKS